MSGMHAIMCQFTSVWKEISGLQKSKSLVGKGRGGTKTSFRSFGFIHTLKDPPPFPQPKLHWSCQLIPRNCHFWWAVKVRAASSQIVLKKNGSSPWLENTH